MNAPISISPALLEEAADWVITLHFTKPTQKDRIAFETWRAKSLAHQEAWAKAESMRANFEQVSSGIGKATFDSLNSTPKRNTLRKLGALLIALPAGWVAWKQMPWPQWTADIATGKGERRTISLADGSQLTLNGNSAVDIVFSETERRLILRAGEIFITTHPDNVAQPRPFLVQTLHGSARALGTLFSVKLSESTTRVAVFEHAVEIITTNGEKRIIQNGQQTEFNESGILDTKAADLNARQWVNGMLVARNMRLADVVAELDRHRRGFLRCDPAVADMRVSGALSLDDVDASLRTLARNFPLQIREWNRYWLRVEPRSDSTEKS